LCSDGLTNVLSDYEIAKIIEANENDQVVPALIAEVRAKGAPDNITIIWSQLISQEVTQPVKRFGAANE